MRKISSIVFTLIFIVLAHNNVSAIISGDPQPLETIFIALPNAQNWKEISRVVTMQTGLVESIPLDQTDQNWSELICMQYFDRCIIPKGIPYSTDTIWEAFKKESQALHPGCKMTWRTIQQNKRDAIYEWIMHEAYKNFPPQHELARYILTDTGIHRVGITHRNCEMHPDERKRLIKLLQESVSVIPFVDAVNNARGLSLADRCRVSLDFAPDFNHWTILNGHADATGLSVMHFGPPTEKAAIIIESLEVVMKPNTNNISIDKLFELGKITTKKTRPKVNSFHILEQSPTEIMYSYRDHTDLVYLSVLVRGIITDHGWYLISHKHVLPKDMTQEELFKWETGALPKRQQQLALIKVFNQSESNPALNSLD